MDVCQAKSMFEKSVPDWLVGVWRRLSIEENGHTDNTTQAYWLQTSSSFGDIRIPAGRAKVAGLAELTPQQARSLAKQDGFAGVTHVAGDQCVWNHAMDYQPFTGQMDTGTLHWKDGRPLNESDSNPKSSSEQDILVEVGANGSYVEEWQRVAVGPTSALTLSDGASWQSWLVVCSDVFIYMRDDRRSVPASHTLEDLLSDSDADSWEAAKATHYLNCEISFGQCQQGDKPWEITLSTLPWKEGKSLWSLQDIKIDIKSEQVIQTTGDKTLTWTVQEWGALTELLALPVASPVPAAELKQTLS